MEADNKTLALFDKLNQYDTPSVTNVVATYPANKELCLGLYHPWSQNWYSNTDLLCMTPGAGPKSGYAVTVVVGPPDPNYTRISFADLFYAIEKSPKPVMVAIKQCFPDDIKKKVGLAGGNMVTAFKTLGAVGLITDGPSRDVEEVRAMDFQYMLTGLTPGHGLFSLHAINVPVSICGMDVAPGEVIHSDINGACKFPADKLEKVVGLLERLSEVEHNRMADIAASKNADEIMAAFFGKS